jgi:hypothetical protein
MQANQVVVGIIDPETVGAVEGKKFGREQTKADWTISEPRLKPSLKRDISYLCSTDWKDSPLFASITCSDVTARRFPKEAPVGITSEQSDSRCQTFTSKCSPLSLELSRELNQ